jgi:vacuolar protein sorting-associated protein 11
MVRRLKRLKFKGVWFYKPEGKGGCYAFEGKKLMIQWYRNYLVVLSNDTNRKNSVEQIVTIYDLTNKYIAFKLSLDKAFATEIFQEWGNLFILANEKSFDGQTTQKLIFLEEKDTQTKLEMLFSKNLYKIAIDLVKSQQLDSNYVTDIYRKYGDHLYVKKKYDEAMEEYKRTIGELEPSYVIRKYLDAQRIHNLTNYLEALHENKLATSDHTTLLLNCYAKLKEEKKDKLDKFIKNNAELHYDVETAIKVCRQSGYIEHALALAKKHYEHEWYIKIQIEDLKNQPKQVNYKNALQHIESLPFDLAEKFLQIYGKVLMSNIPKRTTNVLIRLCSNYTSIPNSELNRKLVHDFSSIHQKSKSEIFIHAFSNQPNWLLIFLENVIFRNLNPPQPKIVFNSLIELYIKALKQSEDDALQGEEEGDEYNYEIPFVDDQFSKLNYSEKIIYILDQTDSNYDPEHILVLVQTYQFEPGILKMYEKLRLNYDILQHYMRKKDYQNVIQACIKYGNNDQNMWIQVLSFFANATDSNYDQEIHQILQKIEQDDIIPPLLVIQILSKKTQIGAIKEYLIKKLQQENRLIQSDLEKINENKQETAKMRNEVKLLKTTAKVFQLPACSLCGHPLDLPAVHFMCAHSYHQRCLNDVDECLKCIKKNREVLEMKKMFEESSDQHEDFFLQLKKQKDGFSVVSDYFGRGIFKSNVLDQTLFKKDLFDQEEESDFNYE